MDSRNMSPEFNRRTGNAGPEVEGTDSGIALKLIAMIEAADPSTVGALLRIAEQEAGKMENPDARQMLLDAINNKRKQNKRP